MSLIIENGQKIFFESEEVTAKNQLESIWNYDTYVII